MCTMEDNAYLLTYFLHYDLVVAEICHERMLQKYSFRTLSFQWIVEFQNTSSVYLL